MTAAMTKTGLLLIGLAASCGPGAKTTSGAGGGPGGGGGGGGASGMTAAELWAPVMKPGAIFTFVDRLPQGDEEFVTVEATVREVKDADGGKVAVIAWTQDGEPLEASNLPREIHVTPAGVRLVADPEDEGSVSTWPASTATLDEDHGDYSIYIHDRQLAGEKCYGMGPGKDSGECEDVCFVEVCVHPKHGLTGGAGTWWPDTAEFFRRDLSK